MTGSRLDRLELLSLGAVFDVTCAEDPAHNLQKSTILKGFKPSDDGSSTLDTGRPPGIPGISQVTNCGRSMPVLKVLQTSHCEFNCSYCAFRKGSDHRRDTLAPDELANVTIDMANASLIEGIFLSSGVGRNIKSTMTSMIDTVRILREKHSFLGYVHVKILPGTSIDLIEAAGQYADRLSINMEAPSEDALHGLAPNKSIKSQILKQMQWIETLRRVGKIPKRVGQTTQFVVGGSDNPGENDRALVTAADYLYRELDFRRVYYSPFNPIPGTPLEGRKPQTPLRSNRLYQADRLLAQYDFKLEDFIFTNSGHLDLDVDPKTAWADAHPDFFPVDVTRDDPARLLRVPGIGPITAKRILESRFQGTIRDVKDLRKVTRIPRKTLKYILIGGRSFAHEAGLRGRMKPDQLVLGFNG